MRISSFLIYLILLGDLGLLIEIGSAVVIPSLSNGQSFPASGQTL